MVLVGALPNAVRAGNLGNALDMPLECRVVSAYGHFLGYSPPPEAGDNTRLDFAILKSKGGRIEFAADSGSTFIYIPYPSPFRISKTFYYTNGKPSSIQMVSEHERGGSVIIEIVFAGENRTTASIRVETRVTTAMAFMECNTAQ